MEPRRWEEVAHLYEEARMCPPSERSAYVAEAAAGDDDLRQEVESLLKQDVSRAGVLEQVACDAALLQAPAQRMPATIGPYRIVRMIGEGGMGIVYEAEQEHPRRAVAVKLLRAGVARPELLRPANLIIRPINTRARVWTRQIGRNEDTLVLALQIRNAHARRSRVRRSFSPLR